MSTNMTRITESSPLRLLISLTGLLIAGLPAIGKDWPQFRGPQLDGKSTETGILKNWDTQPPNGFGLRREWVPAMVVWP
jgi:hypothetical protein